MQVSLLVASQDANPDHGSRCGGQQGVQFGPYLMNPHIQDTCAGDQDHPESLVSVPDGITPAGIRKKPLSNAVDTTVRAQNAAPGSFPQQSLGSVSFRCGAYLAAGHHRNGRIIGTQQVNYEKAPDLFGALLVDLLKFALFDQRPQARSVFFPASSEMFSSGNSLAPLGAAALQYQAAGLG
jgi:hypothetical protein